MTFLFTDIEGSTALWESEPSAMQAALATHDHLVTRAIDAHDGYVFSTAGDAFSAAFSTPTQAIEAASAVQEMLSRQEWPTSRPLRVRMGMHTGTAQERDGNYFGSALNRAARLMSAAHGGQVLVSNVTAELVNRGGLTDLGEHQLKDLTGPEHVWQLGDRRFAPIRTLNRRLHNLPLQRSELIGRSREIADVADLVVQHRLVTLLGIGGAGKTRLALAVGAELVERFDDGVWFVDLVPVLDGERLPEAVADAAGLQLLQGPTLAGLASVLRGRDTLIVLDNCEHLTARVADLVDALLETTGAHFIVTSREPLDLPDEWPARVPTLAVDNDPAAPAVALFSEAAARVGVALTPTDLPLAVAVCRHLDGLPLALELAGAQLRSMTLRELAARLDRRFELLETSRRGRRQRQASLLAVLEDSWALLDDRARELLRQLAAFAASFDADAVEDVAGDIVGGGVLRTLGGLVDRSLVGADRDGRHRLLETVKLFARQHWLDDDAVGGYVERHTRWAIDHIRSHSVEARYTSMELGAWVAQHYDDLRMVEDRLWQEGRLLELVDVLSGHNLSIGYGGRGRAVGMLERIDRYLESGRFGDQEAGRLHLLGALAAIASRQPERIALGSRLAKEVLQPATCPHDLAMAHHADALRFIVGDTSAAVSRLEESAALAEATDAPNLASYALAYRAFALLLASQSGRAPADAGSRALSEVAMRLNGTAYDAAHSLYFQAKMAHQFVDDPGGAYETCVAMLEAQGKLGVPLTESWQVFETAVTVNLGDVERAYVAVSALRTEFRRNGVDDPRDLLIAFAILAWRLGDSSRAGRWLTAVRQGGDRFVNLVYVSIYRQLRDICGLESVSPMATASLDRIVAEAFDWLNDAVRDARQSGPGLRVD